MSQRDGFGSGFLAGAVFGGVVGGIVGALITSRREIDWEEEEENQLTSSNPEETTRASFKRRQINANEGSEGMETARRSLEDKIAQLNATIDEVRQQLGNVNGNSSQSVGDRTLTRDLGS
jgi:predicted RNase H-like nuclease (RuvC/YqgF family)